MRLVDLFSAYFHGDSGMAAEFLGGTVGVGWLATWCDVFVRMLKQQLKVLVKTRASGSLLVSG